MRYIAAMILVAACTSDAVDMPDAGLVAEPGVVNRAPCTEFQRVFSNDEPNWNHAPDWISAAYKHVTVAGADFLPYQGDASERGLDTTTVVVGQLFHFSNGAIQLGAFGRREPSGLCEWAIGIE